MLQVSSDRENEDGTMRLRSILALATLLFLGCAPRYVYAPVSTTTSADLVGATAAVYEMPPDAPRGHVRVATLGVTSLKPGGLEVSPLRAIHIAIGVSNESDERWSVAPSEGYLALETGRQPEEIQSTTTEVARPTAIDIPPRSTRLVHLYFPLPFELQRVERLPSFEVVWTVHAGSHTITRRTAFQRFLAEQPLESAAYDLGPGDLRPKYDLPSWSEMPDPTRVLPFDEDLP